VFQAGKKFRPGDALYLARGLHGAVTVTGVVGGAGDPPAMIAPMPGHTPVLTTLTFINAKRWFVRDVMVAPLGRDTAMMTAGMAVTRGMDADGDVDEVTGDVDKVDKVDEVEEVHEVTGDDDGAGAEESKGDDDDNTACATDVDEVHEVHEVHEVTGDNDEVTGDGHEVGDGHKVAGDGDVCKVLGDVHEVAGAEESKGDDDDNTACATDTGHTRGFEVDESAAASASASGTASVAARGITISSQALQDCSDITLLRVTQLCGQSSGTWTPAQWVRARNAGGVHIFGTHITLESCHVFNAAGVYINYHATNATVRNCIIENFSSDAMNIKASNATIEHTIIVGAHKVDGNHNDLCQGWASSNVVFRGNKLIAYRGPPGPLTARDVQGLGAYDGWKKGWIVTDNLVATDHPIGIWLQGDDACIVGNNTVLRCGASLFFASQPTSILVGPSKSRGRQGQIPCVQQPGRGLPLGQLPGHRRGQPNPEARGKGSASALASQPSFDAGGVPAVSSGVQPRAPGRRAGPGLGNPGAWPGAGCGLGAHRVPQHRHPAARCRGGRLPHRRHEPLCVHTRVFCVRCRHHSNPGHPRCVRDTRVVARIQKNVHPDRQTTTAPFGKKGKKNLNRPYS
jgi:hypothetical protein